MQIGLSCSKPEEEVISPVGHLGHLANERAVFKGRLAACGVHALNERRIGEDAGTLRLVRDCAEQQPREALVSTVTKIHKSSHHLLAAGALHVGPAKWFIKGALPTNNVASGTALPQSVPFHC